MSDAAAVRGDPSAGSQSPWSAWATLVSTLIKLKACKSRVLFIANPGNAGDALIASATWQLFDRLGVPVAASRVRHIASGDVVVYGGGGNLVPLYSDARVALEAALERGVQRFVLLPHTVRGHETLLGSLDPRFSLFCRDRSSLEHARRHAPLAQVALCPDMALGLDVSMLRRRAASMRVQFAARWAALRQGHRKSYSDWRTATRNMEPGHDGRLQVLRSDVEAATQPGDKAGDLSGLYCSNLRSRNECDAVSERLLEVVNRARAVHTDRLHVAIAAQLLGKPVTLADNSYGKNHAVANTFKALMPWVTLC